MEYKELIRKVHPDLNPDLPNATQMAQLVNQNKNNPFKLKDFAIQWGFVEKPKGYTAPNNQSSYVFVVGDMIWFNVNGERKSGFIYKIDGNSSFNTYYVYDFRSNKCLKTNAQKGKEPFKFDRKLGQMDFRYYFDKYIMYREVDGSLYPNRNYSNDGLYVSFLHKGGSFRFSVVKTTAKMVFYMDIDGSIKRSNLSKVFKIFVKRGL